MGRRRRQGLSEARSFWQFLGGSRVYLHPSALLDYRYYFVRALLKVLLVVPMLSGGGIVKLDERTVTKLDIGLLASQREAGTGSGAVRDALLNDGLAIVGETNGLGVGAGNAETRVRALSDFPGVANLHNWWLEVLVNGELMPNPMYAGVLGKSS